MGDIREIKIIMKREKRAVNEKEGTVRSCVDDKWTIG